MNHQELLFLRAIAYHLRVLCLEMTTRAGSGHLTSCLSAADLIAALFFHTMRFDPEDPDNPNNDRFILSKGHGAPLLYAVWHFLGVIPKKDLEGYRTLNSVLEGHPTLRFSRSEAATGSLGQGLSIGLGMAMVAKMDNRENKTYVLLGDGELAEGSVWEAIEIAAFYKMNNLMAIVDVNRLGQSDPTMDQHHINRYQAKFAAFGWEPLAVDGHSMQEIVAILDEAQKYSEKPVVLIAKTIKGYGLSLEDKPGFHGKALKSGEEYEQALDTLKRRFNEEVHFAIDTYKWKPKLPVKATAPKQHFIKLPFPHYAREDKIPTRKAYGQALAECGQFNDAIVSLDGDVKNSTYAEIFEEKFPHRFIQCFIAEQNMVGMSVGMAYRGKVSFTSTFGAFFTRAFDQLRMAAIGQAPLRCVGSHAGVSIGQDGPSQMALEDIALFNSLPHSVILYPSDAVSTYRLVELMANRYDGITYLRTTRSATPVLYVNDEQFEIGGCKVLHQSEQDRALIVTAGITLFEALQAYALLLKDGIHVSLIDAYSIKPLAEDTIRRMAQKAENNIITVEDHYLWGGLGNIVAAAVCNDDIQVKKLAVQKIPRSGKPEELLSFVGIDAASIVHAVKQCISG